MCVSSHVENFITEHSIWMKNEMPYTLDLCKFILFLRFFFLWFSYQLKWREAEHSITFIFNKLEMKSFLPLIISNLSRLCYDDGINETTDDVKIFNIKILLFPWIAMFVIFIFFFFSQKSAYFSFEFCFFISLNLLQAIP